MTEGFEIPTNSHERRNTEVNVTRDFLDRQYGSTQGIAWIGTKSNDVFTQTKFEWPAQADEMVRAIQMADYEGDVWFTVHLSNDPKSKSKGSSIERLRIHADIDRDLNTEDRQKIAQLGAWTVKSGSAGHAHVYIELDRNVTLEEYELLQRGLIKFLDADKSKICDNDLLRIPGTNNHKPEPKGGPVEMGLPYEKATVWTPERLGQVLKVSEIVQQKANAVTSGEIVPVRVPVLPEGVAMSLSNLSGDRSDDIYAVVCEAAKAGLTIGQAFGIILAEPALASREKQVGRAAMVRDMHRIWAKATAKADLMQAEREDDWSDIMGPDWKPTTVGPNTTDDLPVAFRPAEEFKVRKASEMARPRRMEWLAEGRIPKSATTILVGDEGIGKSLFWVHLTAIITNGWAAPHLGIKAGRPQHVMVVLNEDDWATTVAPRLEAAGANLDYVMVVSADDEGRISPSFPDPNAMQAMRAGMQENEVALIVIDTWVNSLKGIELKDPVKARGALRPWNDVAQEFRTSVLLITHTNRITSKNTRDIMGGTSELRKSARSMILAQLDPSGRLTIGVDKSNVAAAQSAGIYKIDTAEVPFEDGEYESMPVLAFQGDCEQTAQEIHQAVVDSTNDEATEKKDCGKWMEDYIISNGGSVESNDLNKAAKANDFTEHAIKGARRKLTEKLGRKLAQKIGDQWYCVIG
jgi:hypothetical protein